MSEYNYSNELERERTQKYEGTYTSEEIELNKKLLEECDKKIIDYTVVEELLKQGADPLGGTGIYGWDLVGHVYEEIICFSSEYESVNIPKITELFLKYGMNIDEPRIPYDDEYSINPLWSLSYATNKNSIKALKMLLDYGLSANSFSDFWDHSMMDFWLECGDPENDEFWDEACIWTFKMILLGASYDHIFNDDKELRELVCSSYNTNDIHIFRNWDDFEYHFDTSYCEGHPQLYGSIIHIYSKKNGEEVWKIGVGEIGINALKKHNVT